MFKFLFIRDGLQESAIITKTIIVENTQKHTTDDYYDMDLPYSDLKVRFLNLLQIFYVDKIIFKYFKINAN